MPSYSLFAHPRSTLLMRAVMLWLMLAFTAALAAPIVQPQSMELLCSGTGSARLLVGGSDEADTAANMSPDCPLCLQASAPPPRSQLLVVSPSVQFDALQITAVSHPVRLSLPPLPARGPPRAARL
jgi:hypothetical protein